MKAGKTILSGKFSSADHGGRAAYGMNILRSLERWDRGFESHLRHGYMCAFILFVLFRV
jgi:hypothetical protein